MRIFHKLFTIHEVDQDEECHNTRKDFVASLVFALLSALPVQVFAQTSDIFQYSRFERRH